VLINGRELAAQTAPAGRAATTVPANNKETLRVATREVAPFVVREGGQWRGFSIELWREIARELDMRYEFVLRPTVKELLDTVQSGGADVGIAAISVTSERERRFDFSQPMFNAGLQIMVRAQSDGGGSGILWQILSSPELKPLLMALPLLVLIPAHLIWLVERNHKEGLIENKKYLPGIGKAMWWAAGIIGAQADEMPKTLVGRLIAIFMMFVGVVFVAFFTAALTTALTVQTLRGDIKDPSDLPGKKVATIAESTSATYLRQNRSQVTEVKTIEEAYQLLEKGRVQAVVFDAPVLLYHASHEGSGKVQVVGSVFRPEDYGIVFPTGSPLRKRVNGALLNLRENGTYQDLYEKWFGTQP
jgi:polar amino acid transport system substrate-binding protein